ncbi:MAG: amino acid adenylation domain-containing protein, partial [Rhodobacteraceae bacterium]|nr:amino acid adenylation domain-containing protein [Paracoccaceae bacterium]
RGVWWVICVLGIMKSGAAYVGVDPTYPLVRRRVLVADSGVDLVLVDGANGGDLGEVECVDVADIESLLSGFSATAPAIEIDPLLPAYVIYTSGSTGEPKGVEVPHRGLANLVNWFARSFDLGPGRQVTAVANMGFDASVWEIWSALASGSCLHILPEDLVGDPGAMVSWWGGLGADSGFLPTPLGEYALETGAVAKNTRWLHVGGDRLRRKPPAGAGFTLVNNYGPTEASVITTSGPVGAEPGFIDIGRPVDNVSVYILDANLNMAPIGVKGALYIAGDGLAQGYLGRPGQTAAAFLPNPFGAAGARMYHSGDLARFLSDGRIEFLGRADHQVSLRGYRIEIGEIEAALNALSTVRECAVATQEGADGLMLVAYIVPHGMLDKAGLQSALAATLPGYMIPSEFVVLDALPLTPNGKIDTRALPAIEASEATDNPPPEGKTETQLAQIWAQLLGHEQIGRQDDFFRLGGHSLLATRLIAHINEVFSVELPLIDVFDARTLSVLAQKIKAASSSSIPPLEPCASTGPTPLSYAQNRLWFLDQLEPGNPFYNIPAALRVEGALDQAQLARALNKVVQRHGALRTKFAMFGDQPMQVVEPASTATFAQTDLSGLAPEAQKTAVAKAAEAVANHRFDLGSGPLIEAKVLKLAAQTHILLFNIHHIVADGWSMGVLIREVSALYSAYVAGKPNPLPEVAVQYADFAAWQRQWLVGEVWGQEVSYWQKQLVDLPSTPLPLPTDTPRPAKQSHRGGTVSFSLKVELVAELTALADRHNATLFMVLQAALSVLMARLSGQADIALGAPVANRRHRHTEDLIGFFVNTLVLRNTVDPNQPFEVFLAQARDTAMDAFAHQDIPFEQLVEALNPERSLAYSPLFQVAIVLQNAPMGALELPGARLIPMENPVTTAKFDLLMALFESEDGLSGSIEYATDLFAPATIARMAAQFTELLGSIAQNPATKTGQLKLIPKTEADLIGGFDVALPAGKTSCLHRLIEAQAARSPEAVALEMGGITMSYADLNARANRLAHVLIKAGAGPEQAVGLMFERGFDLIIAMLAILKSGAAYLPLDPDYPAARLAFMLQDTAPKTVLCATDLQGHLPKGTPIITPDDPAVQAAPNTNPAVKTDPQNLAYIIYTSGSTG